MRRISENSWMQLCCKIYSIVKLYLLHIQIWYRRYYHYLHQVHEKRIQWEALGIAEPKHPLRVCYHKYARQMCPIVLGVLSKDLIYLGATRRSLLKKLSLLLIL